MDRVEAFESVIDTEDMSEEEIIKAKVKLLKDALSGKFPDISKMNGDDQKKVQRCGRDLKQRQKNLQEYENRARAAALKKPAAQPGIFLFEELIDSCEQTLSKRCERLL